MSEKLKFFLKLDYFFRIAYDLLLKFQAVHRGENTCQYCQKVFARPYTLVTHIARVHKNNIGNDASNVASDASNAGSNASNVGNNASNVAGDANKENKKNVNNDDEASSSDEYLNQSDFFDI
jgi:hypothetical protein